MSPGTISALAKGMDEALIPIQLTMAERDVLRHGLIQWIGPALYRLTDTTAAAMGFQSRDDFFNNQMRLLEAVEQGEPLTAEDWRRVLVATEINFASDVLGTGDEWEIVTPLDDGDTIRVLRGLQRKILHVTVKHRGQDGRGPA